MRQQVDALEKATADRAAANQAAIAEFRQAITDQSAAAQTESNRALDALRLRVDALEPTTAGLEVQLASAADTEQLESLIARVEQLESTANAPATAPAANPRLAARVSALEARVQDTRPDTATELASGLKAVSAEIDGIGSRLRTLEGREPADLAPVETAVAALNSAVAGLQSDLSSLSERISALDPSSKLANMDATIADARDRAAAAAASAAAVAPAIAALSFADALAAGRPFATELSALRAHGAADEDLSALEPFAKVGVLQKATLVAAFDLHATSLLQGQETPSTQAGPLDRIIQSARGLVEVRPAGPVAGDDVFAITSRILAALSGGDLAVALDEWRQLPDDLREPSEEWANQVEARITGDRIAGGIRDSAVARLASETSR